MEEERKEEREGEEAEAASKREGAWRGPCVCPHFTEKRQAGWQCLVPGKRGPWLVGAAAEDQARPLLRVPHSTRD